MSWQNRRMTATEYRRITGLLGMNIGQTARFLGIAEKTSYRYADGDGRVPGPTSLLLRLMFHVGEMPDVPKYRGIRARRAAEKLGQSL